MKSYFVFTDEAGAYKGNDATAKFRRSHPFYIRANALMASEEYRAYQKDMQTLNAMYEIPIDEEIKWNDLWAVAIGRPRTATIAQMSEDRLKGYYRKVFERATRVYPKNCVNAQAVQNANQLKESGQRSHPMSACVHHSMPDGRCQGRRVAPFIGAPQGRGDP